MKLQRPTLLPIHPQSWARPAGNIDFRVTQRFAVPDSFYGGSQQHNAVDLGNFRCGDAVVAMQAGIARRTQDNATALGARTDALGMIVDHGDGISSEYWHLNGYSVASGVRVVVGQQIGIVGRTGLGDVCHLHVEVKRGGVRIDPEPLMFGVTLIVDSEDSMPLPANTPIATCVIGADNNLRKGLPSRDSEAYLLTAAGTFSVLGYEPSGGSYSIGGKTGTEWLLVGRDSEWWVAAPLCTDLKLTDAGKKVLAASLTVGSITPEQVEQAKRLEFIRGRDEGTAAYTSAGVTAAKGVTP